MSRHLDVVTLSGDEYDTLLANAERYRWLRSRRVSGEQLDDPVVLCRYANLPTCDDIDAAIDRAIADEMLLTSDARDEGR